MKRISLARRLSRVLPLVLLVLSPCLAAAQAVAPPTGGPSYLFGIGDIVLDPTNLAKNIEHYARRLQQLDIQKRQIQAQFDALRKLPNPNWRNLGQLAQQLDLVVAQANGIAYSLRDAERLFRETFPGFQAPRGGWTPQLARLQADRTLATLQGVVAGAGAHGREMQGAMQTLNQIKGRMGGTTGTQQAIELQTTMAGFAADQAALLRQAVVMQTNAMAVVEAQRLQQQAVSAAVLEEAARRMAAYRPTGTGGFSGSRSAPGGVPR